MNQPQEPVAGSIFGFRLFRPIMSDHFFSIEIWKLSERHKCWKQKKTWISKQKYLLMKDWGMSKKNLEICWISLYATKSTYLSAMNLFLKMFIIIKSWLTRFLWNSRFMKLEIMRVNRILLISFLYLRKQI